jgi:hypothetical protein
MVGIWLTAGHRDRHMVPGGGRGHAVAGDEFDPEPLTSGLERIRQTNANSRCR